MVMEIVSQSETDNGKMMLRLCLPMSLLSPVTVFAATNEQCRMTALLCLQLPTCSLYQQPVPPYSRSLYTSSLVRTGQILPSQRSESTEDFKTIDFTNILTDFSPLVAEVLMTPNLCSERRRRTCSTEFYLQRGLEYYIRNGDLWRLDRKHYLELIGAAYMPELEYLKSAYWATLPSAQVPTTAPPSVVLFGRKYEEIDRTLTGLESLRWIHNKDYESFTKGQNTGMKLSQNSFDELCDFFHESLDNFRNTDAVNTLIMMQMTNDLGKSTKLQEDVASRLPTHLKASNNHDVLMHQALKYCPDLVLSFQKLPIHQRQAVGKLVELSAVFNPGQIMQGEAPPGVLQILKELTLNQEHLNMKFMELFLDVAGSQGHVNHEGARTLIQPVFDGYSLVRILSGLIVRDKIKPKEAYDHVLQERLNTLENDGWARAFMIKPRESTQHFAEARLLCMARVSKAEDARLFHHYFNNLDLDVLERLAETLSSQGTKDSPAVLPTYMPNLLNLASNSPRKEYAIEALLTYLSRALVIGDEERAKLPSVFAIVERDLRAVVEPLIASDEFRADPSSVLNERTPLPELRVLL